MTEKDPLDTQAEREADAAGAEAASIGGPNPDEDVDPSERPVREGGGGESEGAELTEEQLRESAEHGEA